MSQRAATIQSLPMAFEVVKAMQADGLEWDEDYRPLARTALAEVIEDQMAAAVDRYLDQLDAEDAPDRRNGHYRRHLLTTLGDIELCRPAHATLHADPSAARLRPAHARDRPRDPGRLRAWAVHSQSGRDVAGNPGPTDQRRDGEPGRQDARCGGSRLPPPAA